MRVFNSKCKWKIISFNKHKSSTEYMYCIHFFFKRYSINADAIVIRLDDKNIINGRKLYYQFVYNKFWYFMPNDILTRLRQLS